MSEANKPTFDVNRRIAMKIQSPEGLKTIELRFPSDDEWIERQRKRKLIIKNIGRGISETIPPDSAEDDAVLIRNLVAEGFPEIDGHEATRVLETLSEAEVEEVEPEGDAFRITLRVPGARTVHVLRMPTAKQLLQYRRGFVKILDLPYNKQSMTINLRAAGELYTAICDKSEGYVGPIPILHQMAAVKGAVDALEANTGLAGGEDF